MCCKVLIHCTHRPKYEPFHVTCNNTKHALDYKGQGHLLCGSLSEIFILINKVQIISIDKALKVLMKSFLFTPPLTKILSDHNS